VTSAIIARGGKNRAKIDLRQLGYPSAVEQADRPARPIDAALGIVRKCEKLGGDEE